MVAIALLAMLIRFKTRNRPINAKRIIIPPLGMSTGFFMFVVPEVRIPLLWALAAFLVGWFIFSYPLIKTTKFETVGNEIVVQQSRMFFFILLGLLAVRFLLHQVIEHYITIPQTAALFFILAFGTLLHWRVNMLSRYKRLVQPQIPLEEAGGPS
ncbi:CcdC family protein [Paenibacillus lacisoli]